MTIALYAEFTATPGNGPAVRALIGGFAEQVRAEPGCVRFDPHTKQDDPDTIFVYEQYADAAAFEAHLGSDHGRVFNQNLAPLVVGGGSELTMLGMLEEADVRV